LTDDEIRERDSSIGTVVELPQKNNIFSIALGSKKYKRSEGRASDARVRKKIDEIKKRVK
jgi:hypothetical protein